MFVPIGALAGSGLPAPERGARARRAAGCCRYVAFCLSVAVAGGAYAAPEMIGADRCGTCHEAEYQDWRRSGHALAFARLSKVQQRDATCRSCHTMVPASDEPLYAGVQCESCHGAGRMYSPRHVMKDKELSKLLGLAAVTEETCAPCHSKDTPSVREWSFAEKVELVKHKKPAEAKKGTP
jgi:nitrate/TMAO reductase-like tetraheme cytochrome c subunit